MANQLFRVGASPTVGSNEGNIAGQVMERDGNGDAFASGFHAAAPGIALPGAAPTAAAFLSLVGALLFGSETQAATVTLTPANKCVQKLDASGAAFTATLPLASTSANLFYFLVKVDGSANVPTIKGNGTDAITAGGATANTYAGLTAKGSHIVLWCDGTQWWQLA